MGMTNCKDAPPRVGAQCRNFLVGKLAVDQKDEKTHAFPCENLLAETPIASVRPIKITIVTL